MAKKKPGKNKRQAGSTNGKPKVRNSKAKPKSKAKKPKAKVSPQPTLQAQPKDGTLGACFRHACEIVALNDWSRFTAVRESLPSQGLDASQRILAHGYPTGQAAMTGMQYAHAWVELGQFVLDCTSESNTRLFEKALYYRLGGINPDQCRYYTPEQALAKLNDTMEFTIWHGLQG